MPIIRTGCAPKQGRRTPESASALQVSGSFATLPQQVAQRIEIEIQRGTWEGKIPSERRLVEALQVSRRTVRKALALLVQQGTVTSAHNVGRRIVGSHGASVPGALKSVVLLCPDPLTQLRHFSVLWIDELRGRLTRSGLRVEILSGHAYFGHRPQQALAQLVAQFPNRVWLIVRSHPAMQRWWSDSSHACVFAGSTEPDLALPSVDIDHQAVCRHAVAHLWRLGHRHIVYFGEDSRRVGDVESEAGFAEGWRQLTDGSLPVPIVNFSAGREHVTAALDHLLRKKDRPTALIVGHSSYYVTVVTALAQRGLMVPRDVSLLSRDAEPNFEFIVPAPACYPSDPIRMALALQRQVLALAAGRPAALRTRLIPELQPGNSVRRLTPE